jgi:hypothetical protein
MGQKLFCSLKTAKSYRFAGKVSRKKIREIGRVELRPSFLRFLRKGSRRSVARTETLWFQRAPAPTRPVQFSLPAFNGSARAGGDFVRTNCELFGSRKNHSHPELRGEPCRATQSICLRAARCLRRPVRHLSRFLSLPLSGFRFTSGIGGRRPPECAAGWHEPLAQRGAPSRVQFFPTTSGLELTGFFYARRKK